MLHVPTLFISVLLSWTYTIKGLSVYMFILNITFPTFILWSVQAVHTPSLARPSVLTSSTCDYLIYTYVLTVLLIIVSLMTGVHVRAWTVYHSCVCLCYNLIRVSCLFPSPFVPFQSSIMNRLLRVRPSQKLVYKIYLYKPK